MKEVPTAIPLKAEPYVDSYLELPPSDRTGGGLVRLDELAR
jgi:hypothetical protein